MKDKELLDLFLKILVFVNIMGTIFGIYYYLNQFLSTPFYLWLFVPDCPLYTFLFSVSLVMLLRTKKLNEDFHFLVNAGLIKYGIWTMLVITLYSREFFAVGAFMYASLFILHAGMAGEALLFPRLKISRRVLLGATAWFLLNDLADWTIGTLPWLPAGYFDSVIIVYSLASSLLLPLFFYRIRK